MSHGFRAKAGGRSGSYGRDTPGTSRLVVDEDRGVIVGATFTSTDVAEWLHAATIALVYEIPVERLWEAVPRSEPPVWRDRLVVGRQREPSVSAHPEDAKPLDDLAQETGPSNKPELGERHPFFVLSVSTMIYGLVGTAAVLVMFFANFWLGMALMALAAAGIALYVRVWVRRQSRS